MKAQQIVMDHTGDTRHTFETTDKAEVAKAMERFKELMDAGYTAAKKAEAGKPAIVTRSFDPTAQETVFFPRLQGG